MLKVADFPMMTWYDAEWNLFAKCTSNIKVIDIYVACLAVDEQILNFNFSSDEFYFNKFKGLYLGITVNL